MTSSEAFDFIVVGAGSAGCVLANRLSVDRDVSVLVLEAGQDKHSLLIKMPAALTIPMSMSGLNWGYRSEPEPGLDGRRMDCARGKVLGGSSAINGMVYVRGHADDFEDWEVAGATGWNYANCLPYFNRAEKWQGKKSEYRGTSGPLDTCNGNGMSNPLYHAFIQAGMEAGYGYTPDYNGYRQEGFGPMHMTVRDGERCSTNLAYLQPARSRSNLRVVTNAEVERIQLSGNRAVEVEYSIGGRKHRVKAVREIVLSAGAIGSPLILQRSGIGPRDVLERAGVPVIHELPGVGSNLQDHLEIYFQHRCRQRITLNGHLNKFSKLVIGAKWLFTRQGLGATNHFESCGFIRSRPGVKRPDIQYHFVPAAIRYDGGAAFEGHGFQVHVGPNKPESRGFVHLTGPRLDDSPRIRFNYLDHQKDIEDWRICLRLTKELLQHPALDAFRGPEIQPNVDLLDDKQVDKWIRGNAETAYHPSCSCKMGSVEDVMAVVDPSCKVRGVEGLRIVDSSIFPSIPNGNLNAPTIMVAERASAMIRGEEMERNVLPVWQDQKWFERQRERSPLRPFQNAEII